MLYTMFEFLFGIFVPAITLLLSQDSLAVGVGVRIYREIYYDPSLNCFSFIIWLQGLGSFLLST